MTVASEVQKPTTDPIVVLFILDTTPIGGTDVFYFTAGARETSSLVFDGNIYTAIPIMAEGFEHDSKGGFPTPTLRVSNVGGLLSALIYGQADLLGSKLTRLRTFERFLDDGATPDPTATFLPDIYTVEQKTSQNSVFIEWRLSSILEQADRKLPGRICLRNTCTHQYRLPDGLGGFDYTDASCPYVGTAYFDRNGTVTTAGLDDCGRRLSDCKLRFGATAELPTRAMPGIARTRIR